MTIRKTLSRAASIFVIAASLVMSVTACANRFEPIYNVNADTAPSEAKPRFSTKQLGDLITRVAQNQGWSVTAAKPGLLRCSTKWVNHSASVDIVYSSQSYSVQLGSAANLQDEDGLIHRNYNQRVRDLQREIDRQLAQGN